MSKFYSDVSDGRLAELYVTGILQRSGIAVDRPFGGKDERQDIKARLGNLKFSVEVKYDRMESSTKNIAIEFEKPKRGLPSGISVTSADLWVYVLRSPLAAYIVPVPKLKLFMDNNRPSKVVKFAGDGNASVAIYRGEHILPIFYGLSETRPEEIPSLIRWLLI